jgi:hypothetical protein
LLVQQGGQQQQQSRVHASPHVLDAYFGQNSSISQEDIQNVPSFSSLPDVLPSSAAALKAILQSKLTGNVNERAVASTWLAQVITGQGVMGAEDLAKLRRNFGSMLYIVMDRLNKDRLPTPTYLLPALLSLVSKAYHVPKSVFVKAVFSACVSGPDASALQSCTRWFEFIVEILRHRVQWFGGSQQIRVERIVIKPGTSYLDLAKLLEFIMRTAWRLSFWTHIPF